jgi:CheY-like chemotaxis protein
MSANILIVDPNKDIRDLLTEMLEFMNYKVFTTDDGNIALKELEKNNDIKLVISQVTLPELGGLDLTRRIKQDFPGVGVFLLSNDIYLTEKDAEDAGALACISSPFSMDTVVRCCDSFYNMESLDPKATDVEGDVYVVEDDENDELLLRTSLDKLELSEKVHLKYFRCGNELLTALESNEGSLPQLIILDINLPGENGLSILEKINQLELPHDSINKIILTGSIDPADRTKALKLGSDSYYLKPQQVAEWYNLARAIYQSWVQPHKIKLSQIIKD